jgi:HSP20 family protein
MFKREKQELERVFPAFGLEPFERQFFAPPFTFMKRLTDEMDRLFGDVAFRRGYLPEGELAKWVPPVEVLEKEGQLIVRAELPGLAREDVKVELTNEALVITGERKQEKEEKKENFYRAERTYGSFYRAIPLPEGIEAEKATAKFANGVLEVVMPVPKQIEAKKRMLPIEGVEEKPKAKEKEKEKELVTA